MSDTHILLEARRVDKRFGGVAALADVSLTIRRNEIYGLIGPNGAGKTTLFNVLTGLYKPDGGRFEFDGIDLIGLKPHRVVGHGIARTFQNIRLFGNMTALENVMVGRHVRTMPGLSARSCAAGAPWQRNRRSAAGRVSCSTMSVLRVTRMRCRRICPTGTSGVWRSQGRSPPSRNCWRWTNRPPA